MMCLLKINKKNRNYSIMIQRSLAYNSIGISHLGLLSLFLRDLYVTDIMMNDLGNFRCNLVDMFYSITFRAITIFLEKKSFIINT